MNVHYSMSPVLEHGFSKSSFPDLFVRCQIGLYQHQSIRTRVVATNSETPPKVEPLRLLQVCEHRAARRWSNGLAEDHMLLLEIVIEPRLTPLHLATPRLAHAPPRGAGAVTSALRHANARRPNRTHGPEYGPARAGAAPGGPGAARGGTGGKRRRASA